MAIKKYTENGIEYHHEETPPTMTVVDTYEQHHTIAPDQGGSRALELQQVLEEVGVVGLILVTHRRCLTRSGSGPGGRVRFGDDMLHSIFRIAVPTMDVARAQQALADHAAAITRWLHESGPMPEACRR